MELTVTNKEKYTVITFDDEKLDSIVAPDLKAQFVLLSKEGVKNIIVDLEKAKYCDSSGLSALLVGNRGARDADGIFIISGLQPMVEKLIGISQLDKVLTITPTLSEAEDYMVMELLEKEI